MSAQDGWTASAESGFLQAKNKQWTRAFWHKALPPGRTGSRLAAQPVYTMATGGTWQKPELPRLWDLMAQHTWGHERGIRNQDREFRHAGRRQRNGDNRAQSLAGCPSLGPGSKKPLKKEEECGFRDQQSPSFLGRKFQTTVLQGRNGDVEWEGPWVLGRPE